MINIRRAIPEDLDLISRFNMEMALETEGVKLDHNTITQGVKTVLDDEGHGYYIIAEVENEPVGCLMITYEWSDWRNGKFWWIQSVFVEKAYRRLGVFKSLYSFIKERAESEASCVGLRLYVEKNNTRAQNTYRSLGMYETVYKMYEKKT